VKITHRRIACTEISGLTPGMMKSGGHDIQEIELSDDNDSLISKGYTSTYVKNIIKNQVINQSKKFNSISKSICNLIDRDVITPIMFTDNNEYAILVEQFNVYQYEKRIMGFYDTTKNSIYLLLNNVAIGAAGSISNTDIMSLIIHELMHYSFKNAYKKYQDIFDGHMTNFYQKFFNDYLFTNFPKEMIREYLLGLYKLEYNNDTQSMLDSLNELLSYAEDHTMNENIAFINFKAIETLFKYLSNNPSNDTGVKIGKLSKSSFTDPMLDAYQYIFNQINPTLVEYRKTRNENVLFKSVFYQEFIASSEVSAMIAGTLVRELTLQQQSLDKTNPIAEMINSI